MIGLLEGIVVLLAMSSIVVGHSTALLWRNRYALIFGYDYYPHITQQDARCFFVDLSSMWFIFWISYTFFMTLEKVIMTFTLYISVSNILYSLESLMKNATNSSHRLRVFFLHHFLVGKIRGKHSRKSNQVVYSELNIFWFISIDRVFRQPCVMCLLKYVPVRR